MRFTVQTHALKRQSARKTYLWIVDRRRLVSMAEQSNGITKSLVLIVAIILIILVGGASYFYTTYQNSTMTTAQTNSTMTTGQTISSNMTVSTSANATTLSTTVTNVTAVLKQNATTQDYH